ncbi:MAG: hypothetical protein ACK4P4_02885 [Allorhizobium sp.]
MIAVKNMQRRSIERPDGASIIAQFDAQIDSLMLHGCAIIQYHTGVTKVVPPPGRRRKAVSFVCNGVDEEFASAALGAYRAIVGDDVTTVREPLCSGVEDSLSMAGIDRRWAASKSTKWVGLKAQWKSDTQVVAA